MVGQSLPLREGISDSISRCNSHCPLHFPVLHTSAPSPSAPTATLATRGSLSLPSCGLPIGHATRKDSITRQQRDMLRRPRLSSTPLYAGRVLHVLHLGADGWPFVRLQHALPRPLRVSHRGIAQQMGGVHTCVSTSDNSCQQTPTKRSCNLLNLAN